MILTRRKLLTGLIAAPVIITTPGLLMRVREPRHDWLPCLGQEVSARAYPELFRMIGHHFGGKGNTFNLPDCGNVGWLPNVPGVSNSGHMLVMKIATRQIEMLDRGVFVRPIIPAGCVYEHIEAPAA